MSSGNNKVEIAKTAKYVKKELLRSPAKTAAMSVLSIVAVIYCGPIFWRLVQFSKEDPAAVVVTPVSSESEIASGLPGNSRIEIPDLLGQAPAAAAPKNDHTKLTWTEIAKWIEDDPLMRPVRRSLDARNPFSEVVKEVSNVAVSVPDEGPTRQQPTYTLEQLRVTLRGVFLGRTRMASINDQVVMENERFNVPHPANPEHRKLALELRHVDTNFVVVGYKKQSFKIEITSDSQNRE